MVTKDEVKRLLNIRKEYGHWTDMEPAARPHRALRTARDGRIEMSVLTDEEIRKWWASENGLEDCDMCKIDDFVKVVRAIESALLQKLAQSCIHSQGTCTASSTTNPRTFARCSQGPPVAEAV